MKWGVWDGIGLGLFSIVWLGLGWLKWVAWSTVLWTEGVVVAAFVIGVVVWAFANKDHAEGGKGKQVLTPEEAEAKAVEIVLRRQHDVAEPRGEQAVEHVKKGTEVVPVFVGYYYGVLERQEYVVILDMTDPERKNTLLVGEAITREGIERKVKSVVTEPAPLQTVIREATDPFGRGTLREEKATPVQEVEEVEDEEL